MLKEIIVFVIGSLYVASCSAKCPVTIPVDGGRVNADVNDPDVKAAADFAIGQLYGQRDYLIVSAHTQIVAGQNYFLVIQFPDSGEECQITVYDNFGTMSIILNTCTPIAGGITVADINDEDVIAASNFVINNEVLPLNFVNYELVRAKQQVVAGTAYYLSYSSSDNGGRSCDVTVIYQSWMEPQYKSIAIICNT
jgi:hypothetical protein